MHGNCMYQAELMLFHLPYPLVSISYILKLSYFHSMLKIISVFLSGILISHSLTAQSPERMVLQKFTDENSGPILEEYTRFLYLPNVASDPAGQQKNAAFIMEMMKNRGIQNIQLLNASTDNVPPAVYGRLLVPGATQTIIFYSH